MAWTKNGAGLSRRGLAIASGPAALLVCRALLPGVFGVNGALAVGTALWMVLWWITRPVHISVTAMLPVVVNAFVGMVPMGGLISQYASETVILLFGADLVCLPWEKTGLDRRLSLKALCLIGPSVKQQIAVWLFASAALSVVLPNAVVCTILTPVAVKMLKFVGEEDISQSKLAVPMLLAIAWGSGIGGAGSPLGGAMNLVAINYMEEYTGREFMYIDWVLRMAPFLVLILLVILLYMFCFKTPVRKLEGSRDYFASTYKSLGKMNRGEGICLALFLAAMVLSFARPLYDELLPDLKPAYVFLVLGFVTFFLCGDGGQRLLRWEEAEKHVMWNMLFLFAGGLALGKLITDTGAANRIAELIAQMKLTGGLGTIAIFVTLAVLLAEFSSNTAAAAIAVPVVMSTTQTLGLDPVPYWYICAMAFNTAFILPLTVRAVPVAYGLDVSHLFRRGTPLTVLCIGAITVVGYLLMRFWPMFSMVSMP